MKSRNLNIRISDVELEKIKALAKIFTNGNVSKWVIHSSTNGETGLESEDEDVECEI